MLIDEAIKQAARRRRWAPKTAECYARILRRVAHADQFLEKSLRTRRALTILRNYREPDASADRSPRRHTLSQDDKCVIERATRASVEKGVP